MTKAAGKTRKVRTIKGKAVSGKLTLALDDSASPWQANIQHSQHNESVSFQIAIK